jgi:hypothetical protein
MLNSPELNPSPGQTTAAIYFDAGAELNQREGSLGSVFTWQNEIRPFGYLTLSAQALPDGGSLRSKSCGC